MRQERGGISYNNIKWANEEAVALLLEEKIQFLQIADIIEECMQYFEKEKYKELNLDNIIILDKKVREYIRGKWN